MEAWLNGWRPEAMTRVTLQTTSVGSYRLSAESWRFGSEGELAAAGDRERSSGIGSHDKRWMSAENELCHLLRCAPDRNVLH